MGAGREKGEQGYGQQSDQAAEQEADPSSDAAGNAKPSRAQTKGAALPTPVTRRYPRCSAWRGPLGRFSMAAGAGSSALAPPHPMTRGLPRGHAIRAAMLTDAAPANSASSHQQRD